jgi:hypothetical protein
MRASVSLTKFLWRLALVVFYVAVFAPLAVSAHVGSPNVFFEGNAGPYPVHVIIHPAEVIPGLAEINVRVEGNGIEQVTALPIKWNTGKKGAPPPDIAKSVRGETNLFNAQLWFMEGGAQSVEVEVKGAAGTGRVTIPVDAVARRVLTMPKGLGVLLAALGIALVAIFLSIISASVRESALEPGRDPTPRRRLGARFASIAGALIITGLLWFGKRWWNSEAADYRNNRLYHPITAAAQVRTENGQNVLRLTVNDPAFLRSPPLVPDHGKLMHLFLMREPKLDAFAHLHPVKKDRRTFETVLPVLEPGTYRAYADVTYETGLSDTMTTTVDIPEATPNAPAQPAADSDDSWWSGRGIGPDASGQRCNLGTNYVMTLTVARKIALNQPIKLRFSLQDAAGQSISPEPYLGMRGHLALRRDDGSVFTHLHPGGSASMASMQLSTLRTAGKLPLAVGRDEPMCQLPDASASDRQWLNGNDPGDSISFPYAFPKPGLYRLWVQVKIRGEILTGLFDVNVQPG